MKKMYALLLCAALLLGLCTPALAAAGGSDDLTRSDMVSRLWEQSGRLPASGSASFTDVPDGAAYAGALAWAAEQGIVNGYGAAVFAPDDPATLEQLATMLWRASGSPEADGTQQNVSSWAIQAVAWALEKGILTAPVNGGDAVSAADAAAAIAKWAQVAQPYTVVFDYNSTSDPTDNEIYEYETTGYDAYWQPVTETHRSVVTVSYAENAYISAAIPDPVREGYSFAGWQTRPVVEKSDLVNGVSPYQWYFGAQSRFGGAETVMHIADMESLQGHKATLYARWVKVTDISTEEGLRAMGEDLYGSYRLTADITLTDTWTPIGCYFSNYEFYETGWWTYAFRGKLDGNGHTVNGLTIKGAEVDVSKYAGEASVWHNDGDRADGCSALFGAIAGANIHDLTLDKPVIDLTGDHAIHGDYVYAAPVAAFDMASTLTNITVNDPSVRVEITDEQCTTFSSIFVAMGGVVGGGWSDYLTNCSVKGGAVELNAETTASHGGEIYVGGIIGECYAFITDCASSAAVSAKVDDKCESETDAVLKVNVGGLDAANTTATGCTVDADVTVSVSKPTGASLINVGGFTGAQRYQTAEENTVGARLVTDCTLDDELGQLNVGAVCGGIDVYYTLQILMYTPVASSGCTKNTVNVTCNGQPLTANIGYLPELGGQPLGWINKGEYQIVPGYSAPSNIEAVAEKYGSYLPVGYLQNGIIWILSE